MSERPIIFSGPMVRAILEGRKTQTRRALKPQPDMVGGIAGGVLNGNWAVYPESFGGPGGAFGKTFAPGDMLWVRETWSESDPSPAYKADFVHDTTGYGWRSPLFMPRKFSRITLRVTDVRVQRLQEMNRGDAMEEGCPFPNMATGPNPIDWFRDLWDSLNAKRGHPWKSNPWVAAITFERSNADG